jgi:hypothetical protein
MSCICFLGDRLQHFRSSIKIQENSQLFFNKLRAKKLILFSCLYKVNIFLKRIETKQFMYALSIKRGEQLLTPFY